MTSELGAILGADEESRSRVQFAEARRDRDVAAAREVNAHAIASQHETVNAELKKELLEIREECDRQLAQMRDVRTKYLDELAHVGEAQLDAAAALYAQIVGGRA